MSFDQRKINMYNPAFHRTIKAIMEYESDTFSGSNVTMEEAARMCIEMVDSIADQLGSSIDGVMLTEIHDGVKELMKIEENSGE